MEKHLHKFLLNYRITPHCTTKFSPAELLFNRKIKNKLQHIPTNNIPTALEVQSNNTKKAKETMKTYADVKRRAEPPQIEIEDLVLA